MEKGANVSVATQDLATKDLVTKDLVTVHVTGDEMVMSYTDNTPVESLNSYYDIAARNGWDVLEQWFDRKTLRTYMRIGKF